MNTVKKHTKALLDVKTKAERLLAIELNEYDRAQLSQQSAILEMQIEAGIKTTKMNYGKGN